MERLSKVWPAVERVARANHVLRFGASGVEDLRHEHFESWIAGGGHAEMRYLEKNRAVRRDPRARFPWARSVVVIIVPYAAERPHASPGALSDHLARYALGADYHEVLDRILRQIEAEVTRLDPSIRTRRYVDTGPLSDRSYAAQAGLGFIGRNGMLIDEERGSYTFIGTLLTSLENDMAAQEVADRCGSCRRCVEACPTQAIRGDRMIDSHRCISYTTIEHRGPFTESESHLAGNAFGCDICQEVCPWNESPADAHPDFQPRQSYRATPVTDLLRFAQADFSRLFAKSAIKRAKLEGMKRNVEAMLGE